MESVTVEAGRLRHRLVLQSPSTQPDGGGGQVGDPWAAPVKVATVWGSVEPVSGRERLRAQRLETQVTHRITIRYRMGVTAAMRLVLGVRVFNIRAVLDLGERHRVLELLCEEGVAT